MSAQTDLLERVAEQVNHLGVAEEGGELGRLVGMAEINNHVQSIVDDPDGQALLTVANHQVSQAVAATIEKIVLGGPEAYGQFLVGTWVDGFLLGAEYMRKRIEEGL